MVRMKFDDFGKMEDVMQEISDEGQIEPCWPSVLQIDSFYENPKDWLMFAIYLSDFNPEPRNAAERYSKQYLRQFVDETLQIVD